MTQTPEDRELASHLVALYQLPAGERNAYLASVAAQSPELAATLTDITALDEQVQAANSESTCVADDRQGEPDEFAPIALGPLLGAGGMGEVYAAVQNGRSVAVKFLAERYRYQPNISTRFRREHGALQRMVHPNIVRVYSISRDGSCFTMEQVDGPNLQEWRSAQPQPIPDRLIAQLVLQMARGVEHAHQAGIVHRDLKPRNVLIATTASGQPLPKLIDFGIAAVEGATQLTATGEAVGSVNYIAPETLHHGSGSSPTIDVYGLGGILYFLICGRAPYDDQASNVHQLLELLSDPLVFPNPPRRSHQPLLSPLPDVQAVTIPHLAARRCDRRLETICLKCLQRSPDKRYQTAGELALDLEQMLDGNPILAIADHWTHALWRRARRNAKAIAVSTLAVMTAMWMGYLWLDARRGREEATQTVLSLLANLDSQAAVLQSSEILRSPENHVLCEALFEGYRQHEMVINLSRIGERETQQHARQLLNVAQVANMIGRLDASLEFLGFADRIIEMPWDEPSLDDPWQQLQARAAVLRSETYLASERADEALQIAEIGVQAWSDRLSLPWQRLRADLHRNVARANYVKYRRGRKLVEAAAHDAQEIALRRALWSASQSDIDGIALANALGSLGLHVYKSGPDLSIANRALSPYGWDIDFKAILEQALEVLKQLDNPDAAAMRSRCNIQNTLALAAVFSEPQRAIELHHENLQIYTRLSSEFPLVVEYPLGAARACGNLAEAWEKVGDWQQSVEFNRLACTRYLQLRERYGAQRDVQYDICYHHLQLYFATAFRTHDLATGKLARERFLAEMTDELWNAPDIKPYKCAALLADQIAQEVDTNVREQYTRRFESMLQKMIEMSRNSEAERVYVSQQIAECTQLQQLAAPRLQAANLLPLQ